MKPDLRKSKERNMINEEEELVALHTDARSEGACFMRLVWLTLVPLLIVLGAFAAYLGVISLRMELHSVAMIGTIFVIYLFFIKHNAYYASCKFKKRQKLLGAALEKYIEKNLLDIGGVHKANAPFDQFIKNFTASLRNDNFASVAATVFPTLGILGTFISIALTMPDFSSQDASQLEREISQLLGGVGTAFYVSIYGIFLSLWWIFFEKRGMSEFEKSVRIVREKTRKYFWTKEEIEQVHFTRSMQNYENLNTIFSKITSNTFLEGLESSLQERMQLFDTIIQQEQKAFQKATEHFEQINRLVEKSMQKSEQLFASYEKIGSQMHEVIQALETSHKLLRLVGQDLSIKEESLENLTRTLGKNIETLSLALERVDAENLEKLYDNVRQSLDAMQKESIRVSDAFNRNLDRFDEEYSQKLRTSLELIDSETAKIIKQLSGLRKMDT
jgi:hypothetical protein